MTTIVTGGAGFIGSALVRALVGTGQPVVTVDSLTYAGNPENLASLDGNPLHRLEVLDVNETATLRRLFAEVRPRTIFHLAAESHVDRSIERPAAFVFTNVNGTASLLEAALDYWRGLDAAGQRDFRFIQVSTDEVYGELGATGAFDADSPYRPNSPYAASKAAADHLARAWQRTYGLPTLVTNCSNNYGPHQFPEKLIPLMVLNGLDGRALPVYGRGEQVRDWLHVSDHVAALQVIGQRGVAGRNYLIGGGAERRNIDVVQAICYLLDELHPDGRPHGRLISYVADRPGHDARYAIDPAGLERELGWRSRVPFERGLRETVAWYIEHRAWCEGAARRYGRERLGLSRAAS